MNAPRREITPLVYLPGEAAKMLQMSRANLLALMRTKGYDFLPLAPGGKPGDRGRRWGLTADQVQAIIRAESRRLPPVVGDDGAFDAPPPGVTRRRLTVGLGRRRGRGGS